uniref:Uncharacterized protein n=1 Tax=Mycena chlorophos TaxID=658473 RepID=A0ABQ0LA21_MYCCL|nr:predicted protein [Mycena chlorophos]
MGRKKIHLTEQDRAQAAQLSRIKYEGSERSVFYLKFSPILLFILFRGQKKRQTYAAKKNRCKQPHVDVDGGPVVTPKILVDTDEVPVLTPEIVEDAAFCLPTQHPLFEYTRAECTSDGTSDGLAPYTQPPPYPEGHYWSVPDAERPFMDREELEVCIHGFLSGREARSEEMMRDAFKTHGAKAMSRQWKEGCWSAMETWKDAKQAEKRAGDDVDGISRSMFVLHRRWAARKLVRLCTLAELQQS